MEIKGKGDDYFYYRLLSLLKKRIPYPIKEISRLRKSVYLIKSEPFWFIVKGYPSYQKLKTQEAFTNSLLQEGFAETYRFYVFKKEPIIIDQQVFGIMEYIKPSEKIFSYANKSNRKEAIGLLEKYYKTSENLVDIYKYIIPEHNMMKKWLERREQFKRNIPIIRYFLDEQYIQCIEYWTDWSLESLEKDKSCFLEGKKVVLHGDVAHHNFLHGKNNCLYLIDFDLISIGPKSVDYVQLANRFLLHINWSFSQLEKMPVFNELVKNKAFLSALVYPSDLLREWNRCIRQKNFSKKVLENYMIPLTTNQFAKRKKFADQIIQLTKII
ncbi:aminoglycoside phosphotransferase [Niallia nealsonii]|uniref:Aminoglycoside phosphotransferase n=2 Tax=Niallia nealsonii TaxID=115979 RepID=A0A2N0Z4H8_9BACI|nr:aminoglycoside phosphotransferase [Niallia nealsonii]